MHLVIHARISKLAGTWPSLYQGGIKNVSFGPGPERSEGLARMIFVSLSGA